MLKIREVLCVVGLVVCMDTIGCKQKTPPSTKTTSAPDRYHDRKGYSIVLPRGWECRKDETGSMVAAVRPKTGPEDYLPEYIIVDISELDRQMALDDYLDQCVASLTTILTDFRDIERGATKMGGLEARWALYTDTVKQNPAKHLLYVMIKGRRGIAIMCGGHAKTFDGHKSAIEKAVATFRIE